MSTSLSPPAGAAVVERGDARRLDDRRAPAAHARFRGGAGARRGRRRHDSRRALPARSPKPARRESTISRHWRRPHHVAGNLAIPLVKALTAEVAKADAEAAGYVHWGATSQDVIDTALVLELRAAIDALFTDLDRAIDGFTSTGRQHRRNAMVARTWLQHALPMPFGLKLAGYAAALARSRDAAAAAAQGGAGAAIRRRRRHAGGARRQGLGGLRAAGAQLDLPLPDAPWHTHRDRFAEICLGVRDPRRHLRQDRARRGAADADRSRRSVRTGGRRAAAAPRRMPHKRNPVGGRNRAGGRDHGAQSRGDDLRRPGAGARARARRLAGGMATFPALLLVTSGALRAVVDIAEGLRSTSRA